MERFLNDLVLRRQCSASAQNQALYAIVFLYKQVLADELAIGQKESRPPLILAVTSPLDRLVAV